jgi:hypothetical protein
VVQVALDVHRVAVAEHALAARRTVGLAAGSWQSFSSGRRAFGQQPVWKPFRAARRYSRQTRARSGPARRTASSSLSSNRAIQ